MGAEAIEARPLDCGRLPIVSSCQIEPARFQSYFGECIEAFRDRTLAVHLASQRKSLLRDCRGSV